MPVYRSYREKLHKCISHTQKKSTCLRKITHKGNGSVYDRLLIASIKETWDRNSLFFQLMHTNYMK